MNENNNNGLLAEFPIDVNRKEYTRYNLRMAERNSLLRFRKLYAVVGGFLMLIILALMAVNYVKERAFSVTLLVLLLFVAITVLVLVLGVPNFVRHQTGKGYDKQMLDGKTYYGMLRVYEDRIEKITRNEIFVVRLTDRILFLEYEDMMVFLTLRGTIVVPARCVTAADAEILHDVLQKNPTARHLLYAKMVGKAETRMEPPAPVEEDEEETLVLYEVRVVYTAEEVYQMFSHNVLREYVGWLPRFTVASLIAGVALGFVGGPLLMVGLFTLFFAVFAFIYVWLPHRRMRARMRVMRTSENEMLYLFTEKGIFYSFNGGADFIPYPWTGLVRAIERADWLEFRMNSSVFEIPKRCVEDLDRLREVVNTYHTPRK